MAVKFYRLRSCFVLGASFAKFSYFRIIFSHLHPVLSSIMPPKRKAGATKEKLAEEIPAEPKKSRAGKKLEEAASENGGGDAKPKGRRPVKSASTDSEPKPARGKKAAELEEEILEEDREDTPPVEIKEKKKGRGRKAAAKAPVEIDDDEDEVEVVEPKEKRARGRKAVKEVVESEEEREDTPPVEIKEKRGRGRKAAPKVEVEEDEESDFEPEEVKPKPKGRAKKAVASTSKDEEGGPMNLTETAYEKIDFSCDKENKLGEKPNVVVATWNVGGIRAWTKKEGHKYLLFEKPDIFCIQEAKCSTDKLPSEVADLEDYHKYWANSTKEGYAGVGLFSRTEPVSVEYGIGVPEHDEDGRCITAEFEKFYVVTVYVPNSGRGLVTLPKRLEWNKAFKTYIKELDKKKPVIVCGDMNVAHNEIDLANPKTNTKNAGFTKEEREGMTAFLGDGYVDTFRELYPDKTEAYTFWTYMKKSRSRNVGWRLDYFLVSDRFMGNICDNKIRSEVMGSDHCPIALFLNA